MTAERKRLIDIVFRWDAAAVAKKDYPMRRELWRVIDALYDDMAIVKTPGFRGRVKTFLSGLKQTADVQAVRKELEL